MDGVRKNWRTIQEMLHKAKKPSNVRGRLDRPDFQEQLHLYGPVTHSPFATRSAAAKNTCARYVMH